MTRKTTKVNSSHANRAHIERALLRGLNMVLLPVQTLVQR